MSIVAANSTTVAIGLTLPPSLTMELSPINRDGPTVGRGGKKKKNWYTINTNQSKKIINKLSYKKKKIIIIITDKLKTTK